MVQCTLMQIQCGRTIPLICEDTETVGDLRRKAAEATGIPVEQLELTTAEGEPCTDDQAISDISTLQIFVVRKSDG